MRLGQSHIGQISGISAILFLTITYMGVLNRVEQRIPSFSTPRAAQTSTARLPAIPVVEGATETVKEAVVTQSSSRITPTNASTPPASTYPLHTGIKTTIFWVGETASPDNGYITNEVSAWDEDWVNRFGGVDDPESRNGFLPAGFTPKENPFYFALPYGDYTGSGPKENTNQIYWYQPFSSGTSLLKNRWIKITANGKTAYGQWEDVGPFKDDDVDYVFGEKPPRESVGLDVSPAISDYLGFSGSATVSWQFIDEKDVPAGPWKEIVTTSGPNWH